MDGFINVNKGQGMTSFAVIKRLKKVFPHIKLGHLGTLDPMAQGVLPVAIGYATRLIEFVSDTDKVYQAQMTLGGVSDTQDAWGNISYRSEIDFADSRLPDILTQYTGNIKQIPPMYSAVHHQGERLYELARQGITVDREAREVEIKYIKILSQDRDSQDRPRITLEVACSKGTYIRTLCHDIGTELGTGAYLSALLRIRAGVFKIEAAHTLEEIQQHAGNLEDFVEAVDFPLGHLPKLTVRPELLERIYYGNLIACPTQMLPGPVRVYDSTGRLAAIATCQTAVNGVNLQPLKVFRQA